MQTTPAIETHALTRVFGQTTAVDGVDLTVPRATFFGFLGPNGAGKSTTIKMLTGLLRVTSGSAAILGHDVTREEVAAKRCIGVVPEDLALFDGLTGREHLTFVGRMYGLPPMKVRARANELLDLMELQDDNRKLIGDYSHGMKKKLALSAALIHEPQVLFLDEPFEGIDAIASRLIKDILGSLVARGVTVFLSSHILEIVEKLCTDLAIIHQGRLVARGSLASLQAGISLATPAHEQRTSTLEEVFLGLVGADRRPERTLSWLE